MKVLKEGHSYMLMNNKSQGYTNLDFYQDLSINKKEQKGTSNQEVIRALINRVVFLNNQNEHFLNKDILFHLRSALALHECRHYLRLCEKGFEIENIRTGDDGHFINKD